MKLGISVSSTYRADARTATTAALERVRAAERAGLDTLSFGDHHVQRGYVQNVPMLGRALADWGDRPAGCLFLLPLWNPVLVAEQVVTLSGLMHGPFIFQTGIGSGARQFQAMGASLATRGRMLDESLRVIGGLFAGQSVSSELYPLEGAALEPGPAVEVEYWITAGNTEVALRRAARIGDVWYASPATTPSSGRAALDVYLAACSEYATTPRAVTRKDVLILDDAVLAERLGQELLSAGYRGMAREHVVIGTPDAVAEQLAPFADLGFEQVVIRCMAADQAVALETIAAAGRVRELLAAI